MDNLVESYFWPAVISLELLLAALTAWAMLKRSGCFPDFSDPCSTPATSQREKWFYMAQTFTRSEMAKTKKAVMHMLTKAAQTGQMSYTFYFVSGDQRILTKEQTQMLSGLPSRSSELPNADFFSSRPDYKTLLARLAVQLGNETCVYLELRSVENLCLLTVWFSGKPQKKPYQQ